MLNGNDPLIVGNHSQEWLITHDYLMLNDGNDWLKMTVIILSTIIINGNHYIIMSMIGSLQSSDKSPAGHWLLFNSLC